MEHSEDSFHQMEIVWHKSEITKTRRPSKIDEKRNLIFQHENGPKHTSKSTVEWLHVNKIRVLDLEHVWGDLKRAVPGGALAICHMWSGFSKKSGQMLPRYDVCHAKSQRCCNQLLV